VNYLYSKNQVIYNTPPSPGKTQILPWPHN
jgi:hypothetical protein